MQAPKRGWYSVFAKLCIHSPWFLHHIYCKWYVFACTNQCIIYICAQSTLPCSRKFFFWDKPTQRTPPAYMALNGPIHVVWKSSKQYEISGGSWDWNMSHQYMQAVTNPCMCRRNGTSTRPNSIEGWPYHGSRFCEQNYQAKMSKAIYMRLYWLQDRKDQGQFMIYWSPGRNNLSDYHSKHNPPSHHTVMLPTILHSPNYVNFLTQCLVQACVNPPKIARPIRV